MVSPVLYTSNVFHILFPLCNVTWTCIMQFALVSLVKKMAIDHPYHTVLQVRASYLTSSKYFECPYKYILSRSEMSDTCMIMGNVNRTLFFLPYIDFPIWNYIFTYFLFLFNIWINFIYFCLLFIQYFKKVIICLLSFWPWQMVTVSRINSVVEVHLWLIWTRNMRQKTC